MYLLLVDNNFISSREIKILLDKTNISCELIKCTSYDAMLDIASKIKPDVVMINFDSVANSPEAYLKKLKQSSPGSYILAFVDPVQFGGLHEVIEAGIDNYVTKPINRDDILLKIKMGLMHSGNIQETLNFATEDNLLETSLEPTLKDNVVDEAPPENHQDVTESDKKMFEELADLFGKQFDESQAQQETTLEFEEKMSDESEEDLTFSDVDLTFSVEELFKQVPVEQDEEQQEDLNILDLETQPEAGFSWPGSGNKDEEVTSFTHEFFDSEPVDEASPVLDGDDDLLFGISPEAESVSPETIEVKDDKIEEFNLIDEAFSLVENMEEEMPTVEAENIALESGNKVDNPIDLPYFDELFSQEPLAEEAKPVETVKQKQPEEPEYLLKSESIATEEVPGIDDKELFGMVGRERSVDSSCFEELFGMTAERDQGRKRLEAGSQKKADKQGKVEYLPFAKETTSVKAKSFPVGTEKEKTAVNKIAAEKNARKQKTAKLKQSAREVRPKQSSSRFLRITGNLVTAFLLLVMVTLSFFLIQSRISGGSPAVAGYQMYVVLSGSMKPAFDTGSLVFVKPAEPLSITEGDIITFSSSGDTTRLTTHRVAGINYEGGLSFVTRGDANNVNDPNPVAAENVIGRVTGSVPYLGYIYGFAQTRQGLIILFFVPGLLLIIKELRRLFKYIFESRAEQLKSGTLKETDDLDPARTDPENSKPVIPKGDLTGSLKDFGF